MVAEKKKNRLPLKPKVKVQIELDSQVNELLDLMLQKAHITKSDLMSEFVARWLTQNYEDLLSESEQQPYKNLFYQNELA
jgi:hypothetical protein